MSWSGVGHWDNPITSLDTRYTKAKIYYCQITQRPDLILRSNSHAIQEMLREHD